MKVETLATHFDNITLMIKHDGHNPPEIGLKAVRVIAATKAEIALDPLTVLKTLNATCAILLDKVQADVIEMAEGARVKLA